MTNRRHQSAFAPDASAQAARQSWQAPRLYRLAAGSAEIGANPQRPEGAFASGGS